MVKNCSLISSQDLFGHLIHLNFNGKGVHTTILGGIVSLIVKLLFLFYIVINVRKLFSKDEYSSTTEQFTVDLEKLGPVSSKNSGTFIFYTLHKQL